MMISVGLIFATLKPIMDISRQEMGVEDAEKIATFLEGYIAVASELEEKRNEMLTVEYKNDAERKDAFEKFAAEQKEVPEFNFKDFSFLRVSPDALLTLKKAGLYA